MAISMEILEFGVRVLVEGVLTWIWPNRATDTMTQKKMDAANSRTRARFLAKNERRDRRITAQRERAGIRRR